MGPAWVAADESSFLQAVQGWVHAAFRQHKVCRKPWVVSSIRRLWGLGEGKTLDATRPAAMLPRWSIFSPVHPSTRIPL